MSAVILSCGVTGIASQAGKWEEMLVRVSWGVTGAEQLFPKAKSFAKLDLTLETPGMLY